MWPRSAPALSGLAALSLCTLVIYLLTGAATVHIDAIQITAQEWVVLAVIVMAPPLAVLLGWLVARMRTDRGQSIVSTASIVVAMTSDAVQRDRDSLIVTSVVIAAIMAVTASGIGSVLGWAARLTVAQLAAVAELMVGALPVVLLTVLVFFNTYVWIMAAIITPIRLWLALALLVSIAVIFVVSRLLERARPTLESATASARHAERLTGTPFEHMTDPPTPYPLTRGERFNEIFILAATQIAQVLTVSVVTAGIFFVLGLVVLSPRLLQEWTRGGAADASLWGWTVPVPQSLINTTLFLAALTFMYISARAVTDGEYRARFLDPLIDDLKLTMVARNRYRHNTAKTPPAR